MSRAAAVAAWAESLGPVSAAMIEAAGLAAGHRVLDLGAGAGQFAARLAALVGPAGAVVAVDPSPGAVEAIARMPTPEGAARVEAVLATAESPGVDGRFDAVLARNSVMYFGDLDRALANARHLLHAGGRFVASVYAALEHEPYHAIPLAAVRRRASLTPPLPEYAAAFAVSADEVVAGLARAGFGSVRAVEVAVRRSYPSLRQLEDALRASGSLGDLLARLPAAAQTPAWQEMLEAFARYTDERGTVVVPGRQVVVSALA